MTLTRILEQFLGRTSAPAGALSDTGEQVALQTAAKLKAELDAMLAEWFRKTGAENFDGSFEAEFEQTTRLAACQEYELCLSACQSLAKIYPEKRHFCEFQEGVVYQTLGQSHRAIECFIAAQVHGLDKNAIDDSVWECCTQLYRRCTDSVKRLEPIRKYLILFAEGRHAPEARQLMAQPVAP
jgi:tetratricopeptide (TPR) repeat protein